jgi:hypothetical protein
MARVSLLGGFEDGPHQYTELANPESHSRFLQEKQPRGSYKLRFDSGIRLYCRPTAMI